ncbi:MAG: aspartate/glutamate racemase family protein [Xanthobacteraceae bacterium]|nr:aspartate/glutamate racemase family protein [Xanthobacteraceae bacterium]MBV9629854.1 aspartate/glutamate racemase family protein [Xanthobacteraceae bacterium]
MHIGLIGGIGVAATEFYYRGLVARHDRSGTALDLTIVHANVHELTRNAADGKAREQAESFARLIARLAAAGAQAVAVTSMTGHFCIRELEALAPLRLINAIPEIDATIKRQNLKTVGILGTRTVMGTKLYGGISAAAVVLPQGDAFDQVHTSYVEMALAGRVTPTQREVFFSIGRSLCHEQGAEAVLLGGTDLCLAFADRNAGFPVIDCADVHIDAIYGRSRT